MKGGVGWQWQGFRRDPDPSQSVCPGEERRALQSGGDAGAWERDRTGQRPPSLASALHTAVAVFTAMGEGTGALTSTCPVGGPPGLVPGPWLSGTHSAGPAALPAAPHLPQTRPGGCADQSPEADA